VNFFAVDAECVVPDDPVPHRQAQRVEPNLHLGGVLVADRHEERTRGTENAMHRRQPLLGPGEVVVAALVVVVDVVLVADVERRVGERQVHDPAFSRFNTVRQSPCKSGRAASPQFRRAASPTQWHVAGGRASGSPFRDGAAGRAKLANPGEIAGRGTLTMTGQRPQEG
jgi:hypothetical protein